MKERTKPVILWVLLSLLLLGLILAKPAYYLYRELEYRLGEPTAGEQTVYNYARQQGIAYGKYPVDLIELLDNNPETKKNYQVTYYRHDENKLPIMGENGVINKEYIKWEDNMGNSGFIEQNNFTNHTPEYWPKWSNSNTITVSGTLLPKNYIIKSNGQYFLNKYEWGYADNHANRYIEDNSFDISWAVNRNGEKVNIKGIDFIKITTALLQNCGQIGEASTEFAGAEDLNLTQ